MITKIDRKVMFSSCLDGFIMENASKENVPKFSMQMRRKTLETRQGKFSRRMFSPGVLGVPDTFPILFRLFLYAALDLTHTL